MKNVLLWLLLLATLLITVPLEANADFTRSERIKGYGILKNKTCFVFDEQIYQVQPNRVIVEGDFRGWNHDLNDSKWWLRRLGDDNSIWVLEIPENVAEGSVFKFRVDDGQWLNPPDDAENVRDNNLIYGHAPDKVSLKAELIDAKNIRISYTGEDFQISYDPENFELSDSKGNRVPIEKVLYISRGLMRVRTAEEIDIRRIYYLEDKKQNLRTICSFSGWFRSLSSGKKLGAYFDKKADITRFRIFAPRAEEVYLYLYHNPGEEPFAKTVLMRDENGVWETERGGNLEGIYYDYTVHGRKEPGNVFFETVPVHISDPYSQVSVDSWGPGRIWPDVTPPRPLRNGRIPMRDVIAYEVHIQDFTTDLPVPPEKRGSFTGFFTAGLKNSIGEKIGFDHILDLGINVVHLQPIQEFMHYPDQEWQAHFITDPYMIEQGVNRENYQWGYRTSHAFAIESRFREKGTDWGAQNYQFRDLIQAFHDHDIAVIVDVVFNHTAERMDGRMDYFHFSVLDKQYYYRTDENLDYIGEYGTEVKSEERPMVQRWIIDQCKNLVDQYGVDGFRIDLAGQTDKQTLVELRRILGPDIIIYGEPWIASADPAYEANPDWDWYKADAPITFFQDDTRNAFQGSPDNPHDKWRDRGYAGGNGKREAVKLALSAGFEEDDTPIDGINYLDIHDNWTLADRFALENWDGRFGVDEKRVKIAATLLFTSLGPVVMHGGTEILRSKGLAPLQEITKRFQEGNLYFHGKRDTYNLARANLYIWENKGKSIGDDDGKIACNYKNMYEFWKGLIKLRRSETGRILRLDEKQSDDYYSWIEPENKHLLGYIIAEKMMVVLNTDSSDYIIQNVKLPQKTSWRLIGTIDKIDFENGISGHPLSELTGGVSINIPLKQQDLLIWVRD